MRKCVICGEQFPGLTSSLSCSDRCKRTRRRELAKAYPKRKRVAASPQLHICIICGKKFLSSRALSCSDLCKRARKTELNRESAKLLNRSEFKERKMLNDRRYRAAHRDELNMRKRLSYLFNQGFRERHLRKLAEDRAILKAAKELMSMGE
jgi:predicted nucleic acid-binding Zn ribbon protein